MCTKNVCFKKSLRDTNPTKLFTSIRNRHKACNYSFFVIRCSKNFDENTAKGYVLEVYVKYPRKLHQLHSDLPSSERMKIDKFWKLVYNLYDKKNCAIPIRTLKQALDHGLILGNIHKVTKFNEKTWLKPYIDTSMKLRLKTKNDFQKDCFKLMNNLEFGKIMENVRKHRDQTCKSWQKKNSSSSRV